MVVVVVRGRSAVRMDLRGRRQRVVVGLLLRGERGVLAAALERDKARPDANPERPRLVVPKRLEHVVRRPVLEALLHDGAVVAVRGDHHGDVAVGLVAPDLLQHAAGVALGRVVLLQNHVELAPVLVELLERLLACLDGGHRVAAVLEDVAGRVGAVVVAVADQDAQVLRLRARAREGQGARHEVVRRRAVIVVAGAPAVLRLLRRRVGVGRRRVRHGLPLQGRLVPSGGLLRHREVVLFPLLAARVLLPKPLR
mmetsp:Transcript_4712/g.11880  ORF Transcript_4712/g.11880 Transcript_4712/m.11880 type:complete len:254 (+) Transcript_4712:270-1031(+)